MEEELNTETYDVMDMTEKEYRALIDSPTPEVEVEETEPLITAPRGYFYKDSYRVPDIDRSEYLDALHLEATQTDYEKYQLLDSNEFVHLDRSLTINFYHQDFVRVLKIFKHYYGRDTLKVINGFRSVHEIGVGPHTTGIAIDLHAKDRAESQRIMNAAFMAGIPTIIPNGEFYLGEGYVHLDIAPKAGYAYDGGTYNGPWSR